MTRDPVSPASRQFAADGNGDGDGKSTGIVSFPRSGAGRHASGWAPAPSATHAWQWLGHFRGWLLGM